MMQPPIFFNSAPPMPPFFSVILPLFCHSEGALATEESPQETLRAKALRVTEKEVILNGALAEGRIPPLSFYTLNLPMAVFNSPPNLAMSDAVWADWSTARDISLEPSAILPISCVIWSVTEDISSVALAICCIML